MAGELVEKFLEEWTDELPISDAVLSIFSHVRDIPYTAIPGMSDPSAGPDLLLSMGRGSCTPKHTLLGQMLEMLGIPVRYASFRFRWDDARTPLPAQLQKQAGLLPIVYHMAIRAFLNGRWTLLDATWDSPLQEAGFPVNKPWDGISDCLLAVVPIAFEDGSTEIIHDSIQERDMYYQVRATGYQVEEVVALNVFYQDLNAWLDTIRK
ncbi:MAG: hypothetical protein APR55_02285 [Methanolinea sp. SDB]|nr:MAG: hypothetical protein APR55_02285 [Methanolinea sp. SDB]